MAWCCVFRNRTIFLYIFTMLSVLFPQNYSFSNGNSTDELSSSGFIDIVSRVNEYPYNGLVERLCVYRFSCCLFVITFCCYVSSVSDKTEKEQGSRIFHVAIKMNNLPFHRIIKIVSGRLIIMKCYLLFLQYLLICNIMQFFLSLLFLPYLWFLSQSLLRIQYVIF